MTALSIPERAREIRIAEISERIAPHTNLCTEEECKCSSSYKKSRLYVNAAIEMALRSERELCAKELEELASEYELADAQYEAKICTAMSKLLRG